MSKTVVVILGAGRPRRGRDPSAVVQTTVSKRVLDWTLEAFKSIQDAEFHFVGGYRLDEVIQRYPQILYSVNPNWETTGSLGTLAAAALELGHTTYVTYSDVVFRSDLVEKLREARGDVVLVADRAWRHRYSSRSDDDLDSAEKLCIRDGWVTAIGTRVSGDAADAEFAGVLKLSPGGVACFRNLWEEHRDQWTNATIPDLANEFLRSGMDVRAVEVEGGWAELNAPQDLARFILGTKAETLNRLESQVGRSAIGRQVVFTTGEWETQSEDVLDRIADEFGRDNLVVRSSALTEDGWADSHAGGFTSVLDVPSEDRAALTAAITEVIESYGDGRPDHQVLIQAVIPDVTMSGVVFTRSLNHGAPYYTINYDDTTSSTESVTSGTGRHLRTVVVSRSLDTPPPRDPRLGPLIDAVRELEDLVGHDSLDVEFAITADEKIHIFQLRPIAVNHDHCRVSDEQVQGAIALARRQFEDRQRGGPFLLGQRAIFGIMPDWNPAEITGPKPRRLALSLYQHLITDEIWARQRAEYGYRDVRPCPLIRTFAGHPYVDIRASFNSFVPANLSEDLAERLVEHYVERLIAHPALHDKVEFQIAFTCMTFDFDAQVERLRENGFGANDVESLRASLTAITRGGMNRCEDDLVPIGILSSRFDRLNCRIGDPCSRALALLEDCRTHGTLAFSHAARTAFVAVSLLRSLEARGVMSSEQIDAFLGSISTVAKTFDQDAGRVAEGALAWDEFVARYGHLRPGTYEITSRTYADQPEHYLRPIVESRQAAGGESSSWAGWSETTRRSIASCLREAGLRDDVERFEHFVRKAIEGREFAKFMFTRNLSGGLDAIVEFGSQLGLGREDLSHLSLRDLFDHHGLGPGAAAGSGLDEAIEQGVGWYWLSSAVELPPLLISENDFTSFEILADQPNFVGHASVTAQARNLQSFDGSNEELRGKITLIPQADPGFDWLFGCGIAGLITMYGGANSHMAIRSAEFGLPAAIGVGENLYEQLARGTVLELDCAHHRIRVVA